MMPNKSKVVISIIFIMLLVPTFGSSFIIFAISNNIISINLSKRYAYGKFSFFIATDSSDNQTASSINESFGQKINFTSLLSSIPKLYIQQGCGFINGIKGDGHFGFQLSMTSAPPGDKYYSPLIQLNFIKWSEKANVRLLKSSEEIGQAQRNSDLNYKNRYYYKIPAVIQK